MKKKQISTITYTGTDDYSKFSRFFQQQLITQLKKSGYLDEALCRTLLIKFGDKQ